MLSILYPKCQECWRQEAGALNFASRARAQNAHEVSADGPIAPEHGTLSRSGPSFDGALHEGDHAERLSESSRQRTARRCAMSIGRRCFRVVEVVPLPTIAD